MKKLALVLAFYSLPYALNAPYLISATALSDSSISLSWRNNDIATLGFVVTRKDSTETVFKVVDSIKSAGASTYIDLKNLLPTTLYTYQLLAYDATEISDTSNSQRAITLASGTIFQQPSMSIQWDYDTSHSVKIIIRDNSNGETGYRIYRNEDLSSAFSLIGTIVSESPATMDNIIWYDSTAAFNKWYEYEVAVYKTSDSIFSDPCSTFTFHYSYPQQVARFTKLSDFPISDSGEMSAQAGDSIILKERPPAPNGKYSIINMKDPANPKFDGYADSAALHSYPLNTLIPVFLNFRVSNNYLTAGVISYKDRMLVLKDSVLKMFRIQNGDLVPVDSLQVFVNSPMDLGSFYNQHYHQRKNIILLNDTLMAVLFSYRPDIVPYAPLYHFFYPVYLSSSGFIPFPRCTLCTAVNSRYGSQEYWPYIHGLYNGRILISIDGASGYAGPIEINYHVLMVFEPSTNRRITLLGDMPIANANNTGHHVSLNENLCTNAFVFGVTYYPISIPTELFAAETGNPYPYSIASANDAIYRDTVHTEDQLQNILLDTINKRIFLIFTTNLTTLSYQHDIVGVNRIVNKSSSFLHKLVVLSTPSGATIIFPGNFRKSDLFVYDISGRIIDKIQNITSNAVLWRPKSKSMNCYIAVIKSGSEMLTAKFVTR